jgi:hypothetical protein
MPIAHNFPHATLMQEILVVRELPEVRKEGKVLDLDRIQRG